MLVHFQEIIKQKVESKTAVGAFNAMNLEMTKGIIKAARDTGLPLVIQTTENALRYAGIKNLFSLIKSVADDESGQTPVAIHLDHGKSLETIKQCLALGYSSVHLDASAYPYEDNVKLTAEAAKLAHDVGSFVQGELGNILGKEGLIKIQQGMDFKKLMTPPEQIAEYVAKTGIDTVAVSLGNLHGHFVGAEKLDFERLEAINSQINIPIVLHGGSGIAGEEIKKAIGLGVRIINIDTDLRLSFTKAVRESLAMAKDMVDPRDYLGQAIVAVSQTVALKSRLFNLT